MSKLTEYKLAYLYEMGSGISTNKEQAGHGATFVSFGDIYNNPILPDVLTNKMNTTQKEQEKYSVKKGDVFLTRTSEVIDELAISSVAIKDYPNTTFSGFAKRLRPLHPELTYDKFMAFFFRSPYFRKIVDCKAVMTLRASFNEEIFSYINILLPEYQEQKKIGDLFYSIERKIRINNKTISELESLAKTIYDYWFLQFEFPNEEGKPYKSSGGKMVWCEELKREIPEGWNHGSLYDIADFVNGLACQKYRPIDSTSKLPVIKISEMHNGIGKDVEWARNDVPQKYIISDGDILFSWSATLETMIWASGEGVLNQHIFKVNPKNANKYYVYQQLKSYVINFIRMAETRKTTMGHITTDHLKQSRIVIPPSSIVEKYEEQVCDMFQKNIECSKENRELSSLRNFLLPMLMNGQVTFKDN